MRVLRSLAVALLIGGCVTAESAAAVLTMSPASGVYAASQTVDLVILFDNPSGLGVVGGQVQLDGDDITGIAVSVFRLEPLVDALSFRCPSIPMGLFGLGTHTFQVTLVLSDGLQVTGGAIWQVLRTN